LALGAVAQAQDQPWHLGSNDVKQGGVAAAINTSLVRPGQKSVTVAVIDSGVIPNHPSLNGRLLPGYDMISIDEGGRAERSENFSPDHRPLRCAGKALSASAKTHGTEIASLIAGNGAEGVWGVNPNVKIVPIKLFSGCGMNRQDLLDSMAWAAGLAVDGAPVNPNPARIINLSFSGGRAVCEPQLQAMITRLSKMGVFVVAAAGNNYQRAISEPANCQGVISVGAVDENNVVEDYSAIDSRIVVFAPGGSREPRGHAAQRLRVATFESDTQGNEFPLAASRGVGTSYAAPLVAGYVSLILSYHPEFTPNDFLENIDKFSRPIMPNAKCDGCKLRGLALTKQGQYYFEPELPRLNLSQRVAIR
jgi:serine protease